MHLKILFWGKVHRLYQTVKGVHGTQKLKNDYIADGELEDPDPVMSSILWLLGLMRMEVQFPNSGARK